MIFQELCHHVLPYGVLDVEKVASIAAKIRHKEEPETFAESPLTGNAAANPGPSATVTSSPPEPRLGLNQARDLFFESSDDGHGGVSLVASSSLKSGVVHTCEKALDLDEGRFGPGYYQCTRFSASHELAVVSDWPEQYRLRFRTDRSVYLLGACITETDRFFYKPNLKYVLRLRDVTSGATLGEGSESSCKKPTPRVEGGLPKPLEYGPHDVSFKSVTHAYAGKWYELVLDIATADGGPAAAPAASASGTVKPNKVPMLVPRCRSKANFVGVNFEFQENDPDFCSSAAASLWDLEEEDEDESEDEKTDGAEGPEGQQEDKPKQMKNLAYGLISRLYFYY